MDAIVISGGNMAYEMQDLTGLPEEQKAYIVSRNALIPRATLMANDIAGMERKGTLTQEEFDNMWSRVFLNKMDELSKMAGLS